MRFFIYSDAFIKEPGAGETIPLKSLRSNRMLFLKATAAPLLTALDRWTEFDAFSAGADPTQKKDLLDGLTLLQCFDLAELADLPERDDDGCRVAGERDYKAVGAFLTANAGKDFSLTAVTDPRYYTEDSVRARQFMNREYSFLRERDGALEAVLVTSVPRPENVSCVATIESVAFVEGIGEEAAEDCLRALLNFAGREFIGDLGKFRFLYMDPGQDWMLERLKQIGFAPVCTLEKEFYRSVDVTFYDRTIGE